MSPGAEACKKFPCSRRNLADIVLVAGDRIPALHVNIAYVLLLSIQIRRAGIVPYEATTASMLAISSQHTHILKSVLQALQALGTTLTGKALACLQCHDLQIRGTLLNQKTKTVGIEGHRYV
jgi:hypothetical protein